MTEAIIVNGYYEQESYTHQVERLKEEFSARGIELTILKNNKGIETKKSFPFDFAIFLDKDINLARVMEEAGVMLFNSSFAIDACDDKIKTALILSKYDDIYLPETVFAPLRYKKGVDKDFLDEIENKFTYPLIAKKAKGSLGDGVFLIASREELEKIEFELSDIPHLYQVFIEESKGRSIRAFVIGHKVIASMLLTNENDFRSNIELGGTAENVELDENYIKAAEKISQYLDLDYCAVDFFAGAELVIEVNSNAFFKKIEETTGINVAGSYADYIIEFIRELEK